MKRSMLCIAGLACLVSMSLCAANLVVDPGFEAGAAATCNGAVACGPGHPGWTFTDAASGTDYGVDVFAQHSGNTAFFFAGTTAGSYDAIQQALATTPGQFYTLTFWLNTSFNHSNADTFGLFGMGT